MFLKNLCLYETPAHPRFWLPTLGAPICGQFVFAFSRRECGERMYFLCFYLRRIFQRVVRDGSG